MATTYNSGWTGQSILDAFNPSGVLTNEQILAMPHPWDPSKTVREYYQDSLGIDLATNLNAPVPDVRDSSGDAGELYDKIVMGALATGGGALVASGAGLGAAGATEGAAAGSGGYVGDLPTVFDPAGTSIYNSGVGLDVGGGGFDAGSDIVPSGTGINSGSVTDAAGNLYDPGNITGFNPTTKAVDFALLPPEISSFFKANPWLMPAAGLLLGSGVFGSGSKQTGTTTTTQSNIPPEIAGQLQGVLAGAGGLLPGAGGAAGGTGGTGVLGAPAAQLTNTINGSYMPAPMWNPYGGVTTNVPTNPYYGQNNPYLQQMISDQAGDVTSAVQGQFNKSAGAYGGSANQEILAREIGKLSNQMRYQDYGLQAQLGEADVNRRLNTSLTDTNRNANVFSNDAARNMQYWNAERGRQFAGALGAPDFETSSVNAQFAPYTAYTNLLRGWGGSSSQPMYSNPAGGAIGGALAGYALSRAWGGGT